VFQATAPVASISGGAAAHGLNAALWQTLVEIVDWSGSYV
jgi:ABC-type uncharacterized transport system auxiliary subunit